MLNRFRIPEIVLGAYLTISVFAIGFVFGSLPHSGQSAERQGTEKTGDTSGAHKEQKNWWNDATADFTLGLVLVGMAQAGLFYVQLKLIRESLVPAKEAADAASDAAEAAKLNAEAVIAAEQAYVFIDIPKNNVWQTIKKMANTISLAPLQLSIEYRFVNQGKTPAFIRNIGYGACTAENLPAKRTYSQVINLPAHLLGAGIATRSEEYDEFKVSGSLAAEILDLKTTFWFWSNIVYDDMFGRRKMADFIFYAGPVAEGFALFRWEETQEKREN